MSSRPNRVPVPGSEREPLPGARAIGPVDPAESFEVSVVVRRQQGAEYGADPADLARVEDFAREHNLAVEESSQARRTVVLSGRAADLMNAFSVELARYEHAGGEYRGRTGAVHVPPELAGIVEGVFGLDDRPQATPHFRLAGAAPNVGGRVSYTPPQVAQLYDFPKDADGSGQTIGIIELGGGYKNSDLQSYFKQLGIPEPSVVAVSVDGGANQPTGQPNGPDGEVMLDIEVAGTVAPKAKIAVYFAPNTDRGFIDCVSTAIHDPTNQPSVISISWGGPEDFWTEQALAVFDSVLQEAAALGVTVCAASGDNGSSDGVGDGRQHVDFPASSPHALACGGTNLQGSGAAIKSETVWNDGPGGGATGGGVSDRFPLPDYQRSAGVPASANPGGKPGRGVPDVCGDADPASGYVVRVDGMETVIGGTSAVAPLWAGLVALLNQKLGKPVGFLQPAIYRLGGSGAFHDITSGSNGAYSAKPGWDPCTGLGSPDGARLAEALAGTPATSTS